VAFCELEVGRRGERIIAVLRIVKQRTMIVPFRKHIKYILRYVSQLERKSRSGPDSEKT